MKCRIYIHASTNTGSYESEFRMQRGDTLQTLPRAARFPVPLPNQLKNMHGMLYNLLRDSSRSTEGSIGDRELVVREWRTPLSLTS